MMQQQEITAEHYLLKALQLEADGLYTEAISNYKKAYRMKPELDGIQSFVVDGREYDAHGEPIEIAYVEADRTFKEDFTPEPVHPPKFAVGDPTAAKYLEDNGYVVFSQAATPAEIEQAKNHFWEHMEDFTLATRSDVSSWLDSNWPGDISNGIVANIGIGQSPFLWYLRTLPNVRKAFASVWDGDDDLLVSFDGCGIFRPVEYKPKWRTRGGWFHIDQNLYTKSGKHCVQGLMNIFKSGEHDGGFVVVPQSHIMLDKAFSKHDDLCGKGTDYYRINRDNDFWVDEVAKELSSYSHPHALKAIKLCIDSGDFVMWDSRTIHCNHPPTKLSDDPEAVNTLKRLVAYICMTPAKLAKNLDDLVDNRVFAFKNGISTSHWPHEYHPTSCQPTPGLGPYSKQLKWNEEDFHLVTGKKHRNKFSLD